MAATPQAAAITRLYRTQVRALSAAAIADAVRVAPLLDPAALAETSRAWVDALLALIVVRRPAAEGLAIQYLRAFKAAELGAAAGPVVPIAEPLDERVARAALLRSGPTAIRIGLTAGKTVDAAAATARAVSAAESSRQVLAAGDGLIQRTTVADRQALGWARATSGSPCAFCAMLASRGPVYSATSGDFKPHGACHCTAEPVYRGDAEWPAGAREFQALWSSSTRGFSGKDARNAFRRALAG